jgi:hypothetical protein
MFPSFDRKVEAVWAPLMIEPIQGSYDRLVFGVAVISERDFHVEVVNRLDKLSCFYEEFAEVIASVIDISAQDLVSDINQRALDAIKDPRPLLSGVSVGALSVTEGESTKQIAKFLMRSLSSLYSEDEFEELLIGSTEQDTITKAALSITVDRLPVLIKDYVVDHRPGLVDFFSEDVRLNRRRRQTGAEINIDFAGSKLVANFGTLSANRVGSASSRIQSRLWELTINRDTEFGAGLERQHEMIVQAPSSDDPQFTPRQLNRVYSALEELEAQATKEGIKLRNMVTVVQIGDHLLQKEAA